MVAAVRCCHVAVGIVVTFLLVFGSCFCGCLLFLFRLLSLSHLLWFWWWLCWFVVVVVTVAFAAIEDCVSGGGRCGGSVAVVVVSRVWAQACNGMFVPPPQVHDMFVSKCVLAFACVNKHPLTQLSYVH